MPFVRELENATEVPWSYGRQPHLEDENAILERQLDYTQRLQDAIGKLTNLKSLVARSHQEMETPTPNPDDIWWAAICGTHIPSLRKLEIGSVSKGHIDKLIVAITRLQDPQTVYPALKLNFDQIQHLSLAGYGHLSMTSCGNPLDNTLRRDEWAILARSLPNVKFLRIERGMPDTEFFWDPTTDSPTSIARSVVDLTFEWLECDHDRLSAAVKSFSCLKRISFIEIEVRGHVFLEGTLAALSRTCTNLVDIELDQVSWIDPADHLSKVRSCST